MRTNVEHKLLQDQRFMDLSIMLGNRWTALGAITELWMVAQTFHTIDNPTAIFALEEFQKRRLCPQIFEVGLAQVIDGQVHVTGARDAFKTLTSYKLRGQAGGVSKAANKLAAETKKPNARRLSSAIAQLPASTSLFSTLCSKNLNTEEGAPAAVELSLEGLKATIPPVVLQGWADAYTAKSVDDCLQRGLNHYVTSPQQLNGRSLAQALVAWVDREQKHLVAKPRAIQRQPEQVELELEVPDATPASPEALAFARQWLEKMNIRSDTDPVKVAVSSKP